MSQAFRNAAEDCAVGLQVSDIEYQNAIIM